ncbi:MAG: 2-dehydropantoate 2-reductase [Deinococcota bacterium]
MNILIWGAGAIGGTVGAYLQRAGHDITFVDVVSDHVDAINSQGLIIEGPIDTFTIQGKAFTPETLTTTGQTFETIFLCVKAHHTENACKMLEPFLTSNSCVVSLQNGLNETIIAGVLGEARTVGCFVNFGADYLEAGRIHYGGRGAVVVGELDGQTSQRVQDIHGALLEFDDAAIITDNIWGYLWSKLGYGAMLFATALTNESIADCLANPKYQQLFTELPQEVMRVALARGIQPEAFNGFDPHAFMPGAPEAQSKTSLAGMVAFNRRSAKTHTGVWRDLAVRKRKTEIDVQLVPILPLAAEVGVAVPYLEQLVTLIHEVEDGVVGQDLTLLDVLEQRANT